MKVKQKNKKVLDIWDYLLIIALILSPMNTLRFWKIGPSEILCGIWLIRHVSIFLKIKKDNIFLKFWIVFIPLMIISSIYGYVNYPTELNWTDIITYIFFALLSIAIYEKYKFTEKNEIVLKLSAIATGIFYALLYFYSKFISGNIFGIRLWYAGTRFVGGAKNPHLLAILLGCVVFINIYYLISKKTKDANWKFLHFISLLLSLVVGLETKSSTLILSLVVTFIFAVFLLINERIASQKKRICINGLLICIIAIIVLLFESQIIHFLIEWISSDENGIGRIEIFKSIIIVLRKNFIIGLGPGIHGINGTIELHNTYLEILAMTGLLGIIVFTVFTIRIIKLTNKDALLLMPICILYCYGFAGFSFRRLCFWMLLSLLLSVALGRQKECPIPAENSIQHSNANLGDRPMLQEGK